MIRHVLLIDDDKDEHLFFDRTFEKMRDLLLHDAYGGGQALNLLSQIMPDLIVLDLTLPGENSLDVLRAIKAHPSVASIPVYLSVPDISEALFQQATAMGAAGLLKKSRSHDRLAAEILRILEASTATPMPDASKNVSTLSSKE